MIIYEFSTWWTCRGDNGLFSITEIEVEEKQKTYVGNHTRINKSDIDVLQSGYGNRMYRLDNNPTPYIEAMIQAKRNHLESLKQSATNVSKELSKWIDLKARENK